MSRNQAEDFLRDWSYEERKVFKYHQYIAIPEILIIIKEDFDRYVVDKDKSTCKAGPFDRDTMLRYIITGVLIHRPMDSINSNYKEERTGGCDCGAWATTNPDLHSATMPCKKYRK